MDFLQQRAPARAAVYLRCYPRDDWQMMLHRDALRWYAIHAGLPEPDVYLDNGCRSRGRLPRQERLLQLVSEGAYGVVLVPGPFVFSLHDDDAQEVVRRIGRHGCEVLEIDSERRVVGRSLTSGRSLPA